MTIDQIIFENKIRMLKFAESLGSLSEACKVFGYSRDSFDLFKDIYDAGAEEAVLKMAIEKPAHGQIRVSNEHNDQVVPFFKDEISLSCGNRDHHEDQLHMALENIVYSKTKARSPQTNGIREWLHKTMLHEFTKLSFAKSSRNPSSNCGRMSMNG